MNCPTCDKEINWKDESYYRCICGMLLPIKDNTDESNLLIGEWSDEEVKRLDKVMEKYADRNFAFFKGRKIMTAWQDSPSWSQYVRMIFFKRTAFPKHDLGRMLKML